MATSELLGGSSPRMRGAQTAELLAHDELGIIPADAGSTSSHSVHLVIVEDHPRGCGEHVHAAADPHS